LIPLNLVLVQGYSATAAGGAMLPFILIVAVVSRWAGGLVVKTGPRVPLVVGPIVTGVALLLLTRPGIGGSYWTTYFPAIVVFGLGMGVTVAPLVTVVMETVEQRRHAHGHSARGGGLRHPGVGDVQRVVGQQTRGDRRAGQRD
jgi:ABC-type molybdate transport system permease subunit